MVRQALKQVTMKGKSPMADIKLGNTAAEGKEETNRETVKLLVKKGITPQLTVRKS